MAIQQVRAQVDGVWHVLNYNPSSGKYEKTITAPNITSFNRAGRYYPITVDAVNTAGTKTTVNDVTPTIGNSLRLFVRERIKPVINITSPGAGAYVTNSRQPIIFQLRDEENGSGINIATLVLRINGGANIGNNSPGMVCTPVVNGFDCTYTPPTALPDGMHTVTINVSDNDGNTANQVSRSYTVDTVPPVLNVTNPNNNFITNNPNVVVQGNTNDATSSPCVVTIKLNGVDQGPVTKTNGNFSKNVTLREGSNTIEVTSTDAAGRSTTATITGTLDTSTPVIGNITIQPNPVDAGGTVIISVTVTG